MSFTTWTEFYLRTQEQYFWKKENDLLRFNLIFKIQCWRWSILVSSSKLFFNVIKFVCCYYLVINSHVTNNNTLLFLLLEMQLISNEQRRSFI